MHHFHSGSWCHVFKLHMVFSPPCINFHPNAQAEPLSATSVDKSGLFRGAQLTLSYFPEICTWLLCWQMKIYKWKSLLCFLWFRCLELDLKRDSRDFKQGVILGICCGVQAALSSLKPSPSASWLEEQGAGTGRGLLGTLSTANESWICKPWGNWANLASWSSSFMQVSLPHCDILPFRTLPAAREGHSGGEAGRSSAARELRQDNPLPDCFRWLQSTQC